MDEYLDIIVNKVDHSRAQRLIESHLRVRSILMELNPQGAGVEFVNIILEKYLKIGYSWIEGQERTYLILNPYESLISKVIVPKRAQNTSKRDQLILYNSN